MDLIDTIKKKITSIFQHRFGRYIVNGSIIFLLNMLVAWLAFQIPAAKDNSLTRNITNLIVIEISILASFPIHNIFTWEQSFDNFFIKLAKYHLIMITGVILRVIVFASMDRLGFNWFIATISGIALVIIYNFISFDKFVFKKIIKNTEELHEHEIDSEIL